MRETSRKPDEIYRVLERLIPGAPKLEVFGRSHNLRNNWVTLGNQLNGTCLHDEELRKGYEEFRSLKPELNLPVNKYN